MPDYLLEIGTEELPAHHVPEAQERLRALLADSLRQANVKFGEIVTMGTPRRLACFIKNLAPLQDTVQKKVKGPPVKSSFDAAGKPLPAAAGFAQKNGLAVDSLDREEVGGVEYLIANLTIKGKPVAEVLTEAIPAAITQLSFERAMRWGSSDLKFSRPIRWMVSLLDKDIVPLQLDGIKADRKTFGNRVLAPGTVEIESTTSYVETLKKARVVVDPAERQQVIEKQVTEAAAKVSGKPRQLKGSLLQEVVNLTEWPHAVLGEIEKEYLELPDHLIETIMVHHQRYFPVEKAEAGTGKRLLPYFVTVANNDRDHSQPIIKQGNERVIRARLADGRFFYFDDQKTKLFERQEALSQLTFQEGLGSYAEKGERLVNAAGIISDSLNLEDRLKICLERTMELCKLDLVTNLVRELPELQGYVGSWYAELEQQPPDVVNAIASHYGPRSHDDTIPGDTVGQFAGLIDKLDNLVGLFALGRRPSGSSDPYALRRQAQGIIDILVEGLNKYPINITALMELLLAHMLQQSSSRPPKERLENRKGFDQQKVIHDLSEFLVQRLRMKLQERGYRREVIDAVLGATDPLKDVSDVLVRCAVMEDLSTQNAGLDLIRSGVRVGKILAPDSPGSVDPNLFDLPAEKELWDAFQSDVVSAWEKNGRFAPPNTEAEYKQVLSLLTKLVGKIDSFFDSVMVNDPDENKRKNRHGLLRILYQYFGCIADFTQLQPLLP